MKLTLLENVNTQSFVLKNNILAQASSLAMGREGVLQTEKNLYLVLALVDNVIQENLIEECNNDDRDLTTIMLEDIEPFFFELIKEEKYSKLYEEMDALFLQRCKEIWDNQHSAVGLIDSILTTLALMSPEDKKEALEATGKVAEQAFERRTAIMEQKADETNSKLEAFVRQYQEKEKKLKEEREKEKTEQEQTEENDAEE